VIQSRRVRDFPHLSRPVLWPTQPPVQWVPGLSRGKERPGRDADPSPPSSAVDHERVELYLYSPYGPYGMYRASVPVQGCTLPLSLPYEMRGHVSDLCKRKFSLFRYVTHCILVFSEVLVPSSDCLTIGDWTNKLSRNFG